MTSFSLRSERRPRICSARCGAWLGAASLLLGACNPVKGLQDSGNAVLSPSTTRYISGPGTRLAKGGFRSASYAWTPQDHYVLARSADASSTSLFVMSQTDAEPCEIRQVVAFRGPASSAQDSTATPSIFYFSDLDEEGFGALKLADVHCSKLALDLVDVAFTSFYHPDGLLLLRRGEPFSLQVVDATGAVPDPIAEHVTQVLELESGYAVLADTQLLIFDLYWHEVGRFGEGIDVIARTGSDVLATGASGLQRAIVRRPDPTTLDLEANWNTLDPGACALGASGEAAVYRSPCDKPSVLTLFPSGQGAKFDLELDPRYSKVTTPLADGLAASSWLFYLTDVDPKLQLGTLHARSVAGQALLLGTGADERYAAVAADGLTGYAVVDVVGEHGRLIHWNAQSDRKTLATDVLIAPRPSPPIEPRALPANSWNSLDWGPLRGDGDQVLSGFEARAGSLAVLQRGTLQGVADGVPQQALKTDRAGQHLAILRDFASGTGSLAWSPTQGSVINPSSLAWSELGTGAPLGQYAFLDFGPRLPGLAFIGDADASGEGRLQYFNFELEALGEINRGVSDFQPVGEPAGILYSIPTGKNAGIWFAEAN